MKVLVNASITRMGGGIQKSVEFVRASSANGSPHEYFYVLSEAVARNLRNIVEINPSRVIVPSASPSHPFHGREARRALRDVERRFGPDVVFSVFGPAYVRFRAPHLMGFAGGWVTHANVHAWRTLRGPLQRVRFTAWCRYIAYWAQFADRWVLETQVAADGLARVLSRPLDRFHVVPNYSGGVYDSVATIREPVCGTEKRDSKDVNVLVFAHWYPHKNLEITPWVAAEVKRRTPDRRYRFFLTFDTSFPAWKDIRKQAERLQVEENVVNLGPILVEDGPRLYGSMDLVYLPTVLETFTATYPEAMACRKPIVTTDLPFARDICGDAALYSQPNDAKDAARVIVELVESQQLQEDLVRKGVERHAQTKTRQEAHEMLLRVLERTAEDRRN